MNQSGLTQTGKIILIILTIAIVGPLVFIGSCVPIGILGAGVQSDPGKYVIGSIILGLAWIVGLVFAIGVVKFIIKRINSKKN